MRTVRTKVYKFEELSETAQQKVIQSLSEINLDYNWWEYVYEDAKQIGLIIEEFELDRGLYAKGKFQDGASETASKIIKEHGENCNTYKLAGNFLANWDNEVAKHSDGIDTDRVSEEKESEFDLVANELEAEFLNDILHEYTLMLRNEYEYRAGEEAIKETIIANEYEFTKDGKLF